MPHRTLEVYACLAGALEDLRPNFFVLLCNMTSATKRRPQQNDDDLVLLRITFQTTMLAGKMKACLCVALAATASGFGSAPGDFVLNPCANPDAFTPEATLPGSCEGIQITDRDVCQNAGCRFSEDPQDADEPCDCGTQELCEGAGGAWSTPPCDIGHHARMSTGKACDDVHVVDAESGDTYQRRFSFWGTACCSDKVPLCCADDDNKLKSDSQGMVESCADGLAAYGGSCSEDMYTKGDAKTQEICAGSSNDACAEGAPPGWFMQTCPGSCRVC